MSKSLKRVQKEAETLGLDIHIIETPDGTHTAQMAADFCGCDVAQIAKSILMRHSDDLIMFITNGADRVDHRQAEALIGGNLEKADASIIRKITGFAIGGVSPLGSLQPVTIYFDRKLLNFKNIYAAAGTPHAVFQISPQILQTAIKAEIADFTS